MVLPVQVFQRAMKGAVLPPALKAFLVRALVRIAQGEDVKTVAEDLDKQIEDILNK